MEAPPAVTCNRKMNHILKKLQIAGAKKQSDPKPPIYKPPEMGELQYGASFSYAETLDLISDGPIAGLVDSQGSILEGLNILQGIYLDDTPIAIAAASNSSLTRLEAEAAEEYATPLDNAIATGITSLVNFCKALGQQSQPLVTLLDFQDAAGTNPYNYEKQLGDSANLLFIAFRDRTRYPDVPPPGMTDAAVYIRAFIECTDPAGDQTFYTWFDADPDNPEPMTEQGGEDFDAGNAAYRNIAYPCGVQEPWDYSFTYNRAQGHGPKSLFWTDEDTLDDSKFFTAYAPLARQDQHLWGLFGESIDFAQQFIQPELDAILELWDNSKEGGAGERNPTQETLAQRALENMGWIEGDNITTLLNNPRGPRYNVLMIAKINGTHSALADKEVLDERGNLPNWGIMPYSTESLRVTTGGREFFTNYNVYHNLDQGARSWWASTTRYPNTSVRDISCPVVSADGKLTGEMRGFVMYVFRPHLRNKDHSATKDYVRAWPDKVTKELGLINSLRYTKNPTSSVQEVLRRLASGDTDFESAGLVPRTSSSFFSQKKNNLKFNYSNVLAEIKRGEEGQEPFTNFRKIFIDHIYNAELFGPFRTAQSQGTTAGSQEEAGGQKYAPQRITQNAALLTRDQVLTENSSNFNLDMGDGLPLYEGSDDRRKSGDVNAKSYSSWGKNSFGQWDEKAIPIVHTVYNPNVTAAFITLNISSLHDTLVNDVDDITLPDGETRDLEIGTKFPTVVNIEVETGTVGARKNEEGTNERPFQTHTFRIVALIEGQTLIDIGNPDTKGGVTNKDYVISLNSEDERTSLNVPFPLPKVAVRDVEALNTSITSTTLVGTEENPQEKRYIKITKLSFETNSVLISKIVSLNKVTEIIETNCTYPFSAMVGTKLDSRAFSSVPQRSFDCKLKLVKIPNNYFPEGIHGKDKRYYKSTQEFDDTPRSDKLIYAGDWDGKFHSQLRWTDNPAWILYDLLTNNRYGMGSHIDVDKINKWQLYKIGRFCDAVDDNGYFQGVTDGHGGLEPRFSCNIVFDKGQKIYDAINTIAGLFRGRVFFGNSEINFVDDRPRRTTNLFTNESVKDGQFFYSNNARDQQYNTIEVSFKDRFDNFVPKIEVIEDEEDIRERGVFKTRIEGVGITSRSMANRVGQHKIFSSLEENQTVAFTAGLESLLCQPGDLVAIEDELKTNKSNFGKILAVDPINEIIRLSNSVDADNVNTGSLTVYAPTGRDTIEDINAINYDIKRERYEGFTITGFEASPPTPPPWVRYTGDYQFSGYTMGYDVSQEDESSLYGQYGLYTGVSGTFLYFETGATGWTFASGTGEGNVGAFDLGSGDFIAESTGAQSLKPFNTGELSPWVEAGDHRGTPSSTFSGFSGFGELYDGVLNSEISAISPDQMNVLYVTGYVWYTAADLELRDFNPYGTVLSGFDNPQLLPFLKLGSPAKFDITDASPFIYKIISMKESAPNEYLVSATKYDTGKFNLIDKNISIENKVNTYSYQVCQEIGDITYCTLDSPVLDSLTTGEPNVANDTFSITGMWSEVSESTGYNVRLTQPNGVVLSEFTDNSPATTGYKFEGLTQVGVFNFCVNALGNKGGDGIQNAFFDSSYDCSGMFVVYDELLIHNVGFVNKIIIQS